MIVDQRPGDERVTKWLTDVAHSCAFTVRQYGEEAPLPDRFAVLTESLDLALHERLTGKLLTVKHFAIYINSGRRSRAGVSTHGEELVQSLADYAAERRFDRLCAAEEATQGWLEAEHQDVGSPVVIVQITFILDGRAHSVRVFQHTDPSRPSTAIVRAIKKAADQVVTDLLAEPGVLTAEAR